MISVQRNVEISFEVYLDTTKYESPLLLDVFIRTFMLSVIQWRVQDQSSEINTAKL